MVSCPLCEGSHFVAAIDRQDVQIFQNVLYSSSEQAKRAEKGVLSICACTDCGFVFNRSFEPKLVQYSPDYDNDQSMSSAFSNHIDEMAKRVLEHVPENAVVLDIGCGQGHFLSNLAEKAGSCQFIGFDPASRGRHDEDANIDIHPRLFDADALENTAITMRGPVAVVVSRHVIEHVADPVPFLRNLRSSISPERPVEVFLETPTVEWILKNTVLQDFFYEHCSYFTAETIAYAMEKANITVVDVAAVFGGQYLWAHGRIDGQTTPATRPDAEPVIRLVQSFKPEVSAWTEKWRRLIRQNSAHGRIAVWGAGAKGVTFSATVDPKAELIDCLIDINAGKQGRFTAITSLPVVSVQDAAARGVNTVIVMNPNYRNEIEALCRENNHRFSFLDA